MTKKIESARDIFSESARETQKVPKKSARDKNCHVHFARDKKCHGQKKKHCVRGGDRDKRQKNQRSIN